MLRSGCCHTPCPEGRAEAQGLTKTPGWDVAELGFKPSEKHLSLPDITVALSLAHLKLGHLGESLPCGGRGQGGGGVSGVWGTGQRLPPAWLGLHGTRCSGASSHRPPPSWAPLPNPTLWDASLVV